MTNAYEKLQDELNVVRNERVFTEAKIRLQCKEIERLQTTADNLCWLFTHEYKANSPGLEIPDWPTVAASMREIVEANKKGD